jgi:hypothetical protein
MFRAELVKNQVAAHLLEYNGAGDLRQTRFGSLTSLQRVTRSEPAFSLSSPVLTGTSLRRPTQMHGNRSGALHP